MGLKYTIFMVRGSAEELKSKILTCTKITPVDNDSIYRAWKEYNKEINSIPIEDAFEMMKSDTYPPKPENEELIRYIDSEQHRYVIRLVDHPTVPGFTIGITTHIGSFIDNTSDVLLYLILRDVEIEEYIGMNYVHTCNDGDILKYELKTNTVTRIPSWKSEQERFEKYVRRVGKKIGYPVEQWHDYMLELYRDIEWTHEIEIRGLSGKPLLEPKDTE